MNLWYLFPELLLDIKGILYLPYLALVLNAGLLYQFYKSRSQRKVLLTFIVLSATASTFAWFGLINRTFEVIAPVLLLMIALMPLVILVSKLIKKQKSNIVCWSVASLAGLSHCLAWAVWMRALMGS
ncbi:hypothetical protein [Thalassomonas actiniarum]|uniref:Uncharacterized protein n=1 Tax=Thalassomonas actiniarum TaxID=485447 RepID=A0AAE9YTV3_9GAMM|nr:hypothetical protein [Thalassomonas actiniarum]WDE00996.1 hypothetical protein SG35_010390 [Thalassomonas actiniarum]